MPESLKRLLQSAVDTAVIHLRSVSSTESGVKPSAAGWSQREELGHLIDSAANNHIRFVRACLEPQFEGPGYQQEGWVAVHGYNEMQWSEIVEFWYRYNCMLARVVERIPEEALAKSCIVQGVGDGPVTLRFMIEDYVHHMQHHLDHIMGEK